MVMEKCRYNLTDKNIKTSLSEILGDVFIYASNGQSHMLVYDLGDCRDNNKKLAKRVYYCWKCNILY